MTGGLAALILLSTFSLIQTAEVAEQISLTVVEPGGSLNLTCPFFGNEAGLFYWYKLKFGYMVQTVAAGTFRTVNLQGPFDNSRFTVTKVNSHYVLSIRNVSKEDEATYFCLAGSAYIMKFNDAILLFVNDHKNQHKSCNVEQSPESKSVQAGNSVTHQCSLLSGSDTQDECQGEHSVYWSKYGSGEPSIRTYYCAVVTRGEILFGEDTKEETRHWDPVVLILSTLLALCVIVIAILTLSRN